MSEGTRFETNHNVRIIRGGEEPLLGFGSEIDSDERREIAREFAIAIGAACRIRDEYGVPVVVNPWPDAVEGVDQVTPPYSH